MRPLTSQEQARLQRMPRSGNQRADRVAQAAGRKSADAVAHLVSHLSITDPHAIPQNS